MIGANDLIDAFARNVNIVKMQTKDLTHEDSLRQLPFHGNCLNWVLGHIAENRDHILELLGEPPQIGELGTRYKRGSDPLTDAGDGALRLEELLAWLDRAQERIASAIARMDDAGWAREVTTSNNRTTTVGQRVFFLYFHETYHVGQAELFRQLAGTDDKVI
ncbi:MAG: DinB family protein [Chloroflexota bacterium]|nr:DinB family protein [Chloroflexota bacterium]